jgi:hypothetical protein
LDNALYHHPEEERSRIKRDALDSFTSFYLPKFGGNAESRLKRDLLKTFSSFYLPLAKQVTYRKFTSNLVYFFFNLAIS